MLREPPQVPSQAAISASRIQRNNERFANVTRMRNDGDTRGQRARDDNRRVRESDAQLSFASRVPVACDGTLAFTTLPPVAARLRSINGEMRCMRPQVSRPILAHNGPKEPIHLAMTMKLGATVLCPNRRCWDSVRVERWRMEIAGVERKVEPIQEPVASSGDKTFHTVSAMSLWPSGLG